MEKTVNQSSGASISYWVSPSREVTYPPLSKDISVDVAIVGAGIAGLSIGYELSKRGLSVAILEDGLIGSGETLRTSAHLASYVDNGYSKIEQNFGLKNACLVADSHKEAIDRIEKIVQEENIHCDFKRVNAYLFRDKKKGYPLEDEASILEKMKNFPFEWVEKAPFKNCDTGKCLKFPHQAQFHPFKYVQGLAAAFVKNGGKIFEGTHAQGISDGKPCVVNTLQGAKINAKDVVIAAHSPFINRLLLQTKLAQYRTYVLCLSVPSGELEDALYWDTLDPYHYVRKVSSPKDDRDYLLIGGKDHKTGQDNEQKKSFLDLKKWASKKFSSHHSHQVIYEWSGQIVEPIDGLAYIGKNPGNDHIYVHTGVSGNGLTYGTIAAALIPDLIQKQKSPYEKLYHPSRKTPKALGNFVKETCNMAAQYADWVKPQITDVDSLLPHDGIVKRKGLSFEAVYKDGDGVIHRMSAICPHLGGVVRWNSFERTWDCPCHGSRFSCHGEVINGPANCNLKIKK